GFEHVDTSAEIGGLDRDLLEIRLRRRRLELLRMRVDAKQYEGGGRDQYRSHWIFPVCMRIGRFRSALANHERSPARAKVKSGPCSFDLVETCRAGDTTPLARACELHVASLQPNGLPDNRGARSARPRHHPSFEPPIATARR